MALAQTKAAVRSRIFLIDAMSFIFRAYHAMQRQRPMSTKTGVPTAATYVFVNMLNKLRTDFAPQYLAAVFDVSAPTFRDEQAKGIASVRKFNIKTQTFDEVAYGGYKANRTEMPPDLAQQIPYIRRALEAYRIPILQQPGFEADDVIGTLARQATEQAYEVYVVSNDKDMLQLVNDCICVLNPTKDNLICDANKVEEILGVRPERVIDVMALRGDSIDNIPGAPGIGDKGSVELIRRFGSVEAALEHAAEVEKKTYRESLLNNRNVILLSKELVTIDKNVPVHLEVEAMRAQEPDYESSRVLFNELEFTTLLKDLVHESDAGESSYQPLTSEKQLQDLLKKAKKSGLAVALDTDIPGATPIEQPAESEEQEQQEQPLLKGFGEPPPDPLEIAEKEAVEVPIALSAEPRVAYTLTLGRGEFAKQVKAVIADESGTKT